MLKGVLCTQCSCYLWGKIQDIFAQAKYKAFKAWTRIFRHAKAFETCLTPCVRLKQNRLIGGPSCTCLYTPAACLSGQGLLRTQYVLGLRMLACTAYFRGLVLLLWYRSRLHTSGLLILWILYWTMIYSVLWTRWYGWRHSEPASIETNQYWQHTGIIRSTQHRILVTTYQVPGISVLQVVRGGILRSIQNPRRTQETSIPVCLSAILGPD